MKAKKWKQWREGEAGPGRWILNDLDGFRRREVRGSLLRRTHRSEKTGERAKPNRTHASLL